MKRILLFRHAKAESEPVADDHARTLAMRGRHEAPAMAAALAGHGWQPDLVLCSTAVRTRQTWELAAPYLPARTVRFEERLYLASWRVLVTMLQQCPADCASVMVVGHNPGLEDCAAALVHRATSPPQPPHHLAPAAKFPTAGAALIAMEQPNWADLGLGCGQLTLLLQPKDLA